MAAESFGGELAPLPLAEDEAMRLKIGLMTTGLLVDPETKERLVGADGLMSPADYPSTSGAILQLGGDGTYVNAPLEEYNPDIVVNPTHKLQVEDDKTIWVVNREKDDARYQVGFSPVAQYHTQRLPRDDTKLANWYVVTHGDRARISPIKGCALECTFCDIPYEGIAYGTKQIEDIIDAMDLAYNDPVQPAQHILISGGTPRRRDYQYEQDIYAEVADRYPADVDVMMVPMPGLLDFPALRDNGIHGVSLNVELYNRDRPEAAAYIKNKVKLSLSRYLTAVEEAKESFPEPGRVRSLLMVGLEPMEDTLAGVRALAERGCDPVLSPFRPDTKTPLANMAPPDTDFLYEVWQRSRDIVAGFGGIALGPLCIPDSHNSLSGIPQANSPYYYSKRHTED